MLLANAFQVGVDNLVVYAGAAIVASGVTAGIVSLIRRRNESTQGFDSLNAKVDTLVVALVGEAPTPLNPVPQPGLIGNVASYQRQSTELIEQFAEHKNMVNTLVATVDAIQRDVKDLIADNAVDHGTSGRDSLNRIEVKLGSDPEGKGKQ